MSVPSINSNSLGTQREISLGRSLPPRSLSPTCLNLRNPLQQDQLSSCRVPFPTMPNDEWHLQLLSLHDAPPARFASLPRSKASTRLYLKRGGQGVSNCDPVRDDIDVEQQCCH